MKTTESGPIKKKVDILWFGVIEKYLVDGDITNLEGLVRNGGVPAEFGDQIADILIGKLKPPKPNKTYLLLPATQFQNLNQFQKKDLRKSQQNYLPRT